MPILSDDYVQAQIPEWEGYTAPLQPGETAETVLASRVESAEDELSEYVTVDAGSITKPLRRHLIILIRKALFTRRHGDRPFERAPEVIRDYERTLKTLALYRSGEITIESPGQDAPDPDAEGPRYVKMTAQDRRFSNPSGSWFR